MTDPQRDPLKGTCRQQTPEQIAAKVKLVLLTVKANGGSHKRGDTEVVCAGRFFGTPSPQGEARNFVTRALEQGLLEIVVQNEDPNLCVLSLTEAGRALLAQA